MIWLTSESDLRTILSDNSTDKMSYRKKCFGDVNGTNVNFRSLEFRRVTDFVSSIAPLGVFVNGTIVTTSIDLPDSGDFTLAVAPANGDLIEASYYYQWFTDTEVEQFLRLATNWLSLGDDYTGLQTGLRPAALEYSCGEAYTKLALRWSQKLSEMYLTQDAVDKDRYSLVDTYAKWGNDKKKMAVTLRNDFYSRAGLNEVPASGNIQGNVREIVPSR